MLADLYVDIFETFFSNYLGLNIRLVRAARETSKPLIINSRRRYMVEILPIRHKTLYNQLINQSFKQFYFKIHFAQINVVRFLHPSLRFGPKNETIEKIGQID